MEAQARATIICAVIASVSTISVGAITAGWNLFGLIERGEDPRKTIAELQLTTDVFPLRTQSPDNCIINLRRALQEAGFEPSGGGDEVAIMRRETFKTAIWCRPSEIVATVAGQRGSETEQVLELISDAAIRAGLAPPAPGH